MAYHPRLRGLEMAHTNPCAGMDSAPEPEPGRAATPAATPTAAAPGDSGVAESGHRPFAEWESLWSRLKRGLGPLLGGIALDAVDLITFGPFGLYGGAILGAAVGWWVGPLYQLTPRGRILLTIAAAVYAMAPFTEVLPLATLVSAIIRVWGDGDAATKT